MSLFYFSGMVILLNTKVPSVETRKPPDFGSIPSLLLPLGHKTPFSLIVYGINWMYSALVQKNINQIIFISVFEIKDMSTQNDIKL